MNKTTIIAVGTLVIVAGIVAFATLMPDSIELPPDQETIVPQDPSVVGVPVASNILVGQSTRESTLTGEFSVPGSLQFTGIVFISYWPGTAECDWEFTPDDLINYNKLTGTVTVNIFESKLIFNENGGFEIEDIYFNGTHTLTKRPITAKNEYHFDDWSLTRGALNYISYPLTFYGTTHLYAQYTYHTPDKVAYEIRYNHSVPMDEALVTAFWGSNGIVERPPTWNPFDPPILGSISGEVVIADMYNNLPVTMIYDFGHTNISGIVFPNFLERIGENSFQQCRSLGPELIIPNTVKEIYDSAFDNCWSLERVEFEDGEGFISLRSGLFYQSGLKEVILKRVNVMPSWAFAKCGIQTIIIPADVTHIYRAAFTGTDLRQVIFEGDKLELVDNIAFEACPLVSISLPASARIAPDAFRGSLLLEKIDITDQQIIQIAKELHEVYIGPADNFIVNIERDAKYGGSDNYEGEYVANSEAITLKFEHFSIYVLDALIHEFFHHYQYVLTYGVGAEDFNSVPIQVYTYSNYFVIFENPYVIVANKQVLYDESDPTRGYLYESNVRSCESAGTPYVLIDSIILDQWRGYVPLLPDRSNWVEYWNQPTEADARGFASWFSGVRWKAVV